MSLIVEREAGLDQLESASNLKGLFTMLKPSWPTLVNICINYTFEDDEEMPHNVLAGLCHELKKMAGQNVVEKITLKIWVPPDYHDFTGCNELDDVLLGSPEGWPSLKEVSLSFGVLVEHDDTDNLVAFRKMPTMTKLVESERVVFNLDIDLCPIPVQLELNY